MKQRLIAALAAIACTLLALILLVSISSTPAGAQASTPDVISALQTQQAAEAAQAAADSAAKSAQAQAQAAQAAAQAAQAAAQATQAAAAQAEVQAASAKATTQAGILLLTVAADQTRTAATVTAQARSDEATAIAQTRTATVQAGYEAATATAQWGNATSTAEARVMQIAATATRQAVVARNEANAETALYFGGAALLLVLLGIFLYAGRYIAATLKAWAAYLAPPRLEPETGPASATNTVHIPAASTVIDVTPPEAPGNGHNTPRPVVVVDDPDAIKKIKAVLKAVPRERASHPDYFDDDLTE